MQVTLLSPGDVVVNVIGIPSKIPIFRRNTNKYTDRDVMFTYYDDKRNRKF